MIYKIFQNSQSYASYWLEPEDFMRMLYPAFDNITAMTFSQKDLSLSEVWKPLKLTLRDNEGSKNKRPDFTMWYGASMIVSDKAISALHHLLEPNGELLPLTYEGKDYALFNCRRQQPADEISSARTMVEENVLSVERIVFSIATEAPIFKTPYDENTTLFCTDDFKKAVMDKKLGGIYFSDNLVDFM